MRVALYIRIGNANDLEGLKKQRNKLLLYTKENNLIITKVYEDVGTDRTNYNLMLKESNQYETILFTDISRISRKCKEFINFISLMEEKDKKWHSINDNYNNHTVEGRFFSSFMLAFTDKLENGEGL